MIAQLVGAIQSGNHLITKTKQFALTVSHQAKGGPVPPRRADKIAERLSKSGVVHGAVTCAA